MICRTWRAGRHCSRRVVSSQIAQYRPAWQYRQMRPVTGARWCAFPRAVQVVLWLEKSLENVRTQRGWYKDSCFGVVFFILIVPSLGAQLTPYGDSILWFCIRREFIAHSCTHVDAQLGSTWPTVTNLDDNQIYFDETYWKYYRSEPMSLTSGNIHKKLFNVNGSKNTSRQPVLYIQVMLPELIHKLIYRYCDVARHVTILYSWYFCHD